MCSVLWDRNVNNLFYNQGDEMKTTKLNNFKNVMVIIIHYQQLHYSYVI